MTMFEIITDTSANLDSALLHADRIGLIPFSFSFKGKEKTCLNTASFRSGAYYDAMRRGLPDPIWWLSGSKDILPIFMRAFAAHLSDILQENEPSATMEETE